MRSALVAIVPLALLLASACSDGCRAKRGDPEAQARAAASMDAPRVDGTLAVAALAALPADAHVYALFDARAASTYAAAIGNTTVAEQQRLATTQITEAVTRLGGEAAALGTLDPARVTAVAAAAWYTDRTWSWAASLDAAAFTAPPAADAAPLELGHGVRAARRGEHVYIGQGAGFDASIGAEPRADLEAAWPGVAGSLPAGSSGALFVTQPAAIAEAIPGGLQLAGVRRAAAALALGGATAFLFDVDDDTPLRSLLGTIQTASRQSVEATRATSPPVAQPWLDYALLAMRATWSRVSIEREGSTTSILFAPPTCGSNLGYFTSIAAMSLLAADAVGDPARATPFAPESIELLPGCGVVAGPAPALDARLSRLAGASTDDAAVLALLDVGGTLRANLPTAFGTLPFALSEASIAAALGPAPLGLASLADPNAHVAFYYKQGGLPEGLLVMPAGMASALPPLPLPGVTRSDVEGLGAVYATLTALPRAQLAVDEASPWHRLAAAAPPRSVLGVFASKSLYGPFTASVAQDVAVLGASGALAVVLDADLNLTLLFFAPGQARDLATRAVAEVAAAVERQLATAPAADAETGRSLARSITEALVVEAVDDDIMRAQLSTQGRNRGVAGALAVAAAVGAMAFQSALADPPLAAPAAPPGAVPVTPGIGQPTKPPKPR